MPQNKIPGYGKGSCINIERYARNPESTLANDPEYADKAYTKQGSIVADTPEEVEEQFADLRRYWESKQPETNAKRTFFHLERSYSPSDPKATIENVIEHTNRFYDTPETKLWMHTTDLHLNRPHLHFHDVVSFVKTNGERIQTQNICQRYIWPLSDKIAEDLGMKIIPVKRIDTRNITPQEAQASIAGKELKKTTCRNIVTDILKEANQRRIENMLTLRDTLREKDVELIRSPHAGGLAYSYNGYYFSASSLGGKAFQLAGLNYIMKKGYEEGLGILEKKLEQGRKMKDLNVHMVDETYFGLNVYNDREDNKVESKLELEDALDKMRSASMTLEQYKAELSSLGVVTRGNDDYTYEFEGIRVTQYQVSPKFHRDTLEKYFEGKGKEEETAGRLSNIEIFDKLAGLDQQAQAEVQNATVKKGVSQKK